MGKIYIVATPIGNLEDITLRALRILKEADLVAAEDTRVVSKILNHYNINPARSRPAEGTATTASGRFASNGVKKPLVSIHENSKPEKVKKLVEEIQSGNKNAAFVTDAGTPGISDPGGFLVSEATKKGIEIIPIPGPSAITAALSVSGIPINGFTFLGYFPKKKGRQTLLKELNNEKRPVVFFESPQRILKTLGMMKEFLGSEREIIVCRELTKKFETIYRGKISEIMPKINPKGEFVVVIRGIK